MAKFQWHAPQHPLWFLIYLIILFNLFFFALAMILYPEPYINYFWDYDVSDLGATITPKGVANPIGSVMFITILIIDGIFFIFISLLTTKEPINFGVGIKRIKAIILFIVGISCFLVALPTNLFHELHVFGAIILFVALWILLNITYIEIRSNNKIALILAVVIINGGMITYLIAKGMHLENPSFYQKIAFIAFFISGALVPVLDKQSRWGPISLTLIWSEAKAQIYNEFGQWDENFHKFFRKDFVPWSERRKKNQNSQSNPPK